MWILKTTEKINVILNNFSSPMEPPEGRGSASKFLLIAGERGSEVGDEAQHRLLHVGDVAGLVGIEPGRSLLRLSSRRNLNRRG